MKLLDGTGSKDNDIISQYLSLLILIQSMIEGRGIAEPEAEQEPIKPAAPPIENLQRMKRRPYGPGQIVPINPPAAPM